ncbi:methyltransferase domain-containing protein [Gloeopeniophorella convolvens]|nr:methyltransferase domain-containing protein [Gloeopeniophorella convolvens]
MLLPRRHPRFSLLLACLLTAALLLLLPQSPLAPVPQPVPASRPPSLLGDADALALRVKRAERTYQKMLRGREALIQKVGPSPRDIALFPPDRDPWPPYTIWDFFPPAFPCPHELERVGALGDGGKWVCGLSRLQEKPDCVVYSVGPPADATFEAEVLARTRHCQLYVFDHTASALPRALASPAALPSVLGEFYTPWAPGDGADGERDYWDARGTSQRAHFKPVRVAGFDAHAAGDVPKTYTLQSLMRANGAAHHIDMLKIDLEGWEFDALTAFLQPSSENAGGAAHALPVSQMMLELHLWGREFADLLAWWGALERVGLRAVAREPNLVYQNYNRLQGAELAEYTFLNIATPNVFTAEDTLEQASPTTPSPEPPVAPVHDDADERF